MNSRKDIVWYEDEKETVGYLTSNMTSELTTDTGLARVRVEMEQALKK